MMSRIHSQLPWGFVLWVLVGVACANEARQPLTALPAQVNSLVMSLGEEQIATMESFLKQGAAPGWDASQLQVFLREVRSATLVHPDVMAASAARGAARQAIREAQAARLPQVSAQLENSRRSNDPSTLLNTPGREYSTGAFTVTVRQLLYDFGASQGTIAGSSARDEQAFFRMQLARSDVALRAVVAFHDLVRATRQLELARRNEQARVAIVDLVKQRYDLGGGTLSDVIRAQSRLAEAASLTASAQQKVGAAQVAYRDVFNQAPPASSQAARFAFAVNLEDDFRVQLAQSGLETWKVRIAQSARQAAQADMQGAKGRALPAVNLELTNSRRDLMGAGNPGTDRSIMLVARQSLFSGWADTARVDQAVQKLRQSEEELESARRESSRTLDQALLEAESITEMVRTRAVAVRLAADSLRMIREQYAYRRGTLLDLLTAQEGLYTAGRDFIDVQVDDAIARFKVLHAASLLNRFLEMVDPDPGR
jgi:adhesin transport system outer membrane protein